MTFKDFCKNTYEGACSLQFFDNGRPRGWVVSTCTLMIVSALVVVAAFDSAVATNLQKLSGVLVALIGGSSGGMVVKGLIGKLSQGGSKNVD
jgi:hypothetical protein